MDIVPTGPGPTRKLERPGLALLDARWLPDGGRVVARAQASEQAPARLYVLDVTGAGTHPVTPEGLAVQRPGWALSPDGTSVAVSTTDGVAVFPVGDGSARTVPGSTGGWTVVGWITSGILVSDDPVAGDTVHRLDPTSGRRDTWITIQPKDPAGVMNMNHGSLVVTPDGRGYGYSWHRALSDLYLVEGWA
jgi:hypothetical protein